MFNLKDFPFLKMLMVTVFIFNSVEYFPQNIDTIKQYLNKANELTSSDPQKGVNSGKRALEIATKLNNTEYQIESLIAISNSFDKFSECQDSVYFYLIKADQLSNNFHNSLPNIKVNYYLARYFYDNLQFEKAKEHLVNTLTDNELNNLEYESKCNYLLGSIERNLGNYDNAIKLIKKALGQYKKLDYQKGQINSLLRLGQLYSRIGNYERALEFQHNALNLAIESNDDLLKIKAFTRIGILYKNLKDFKNAIKFLQQAKSIVDINENIPQDGNVLIALGRIYKNTGDIENALKYYDLAYNIAKSQKDMRLEMDCHKALGNIYKNKKNFVKALFNYNKALIIAQNHNFHSDMLIVMQNIGVVNSFLGNHSIAINFLSKAMEMAKKNKSFEILEECYEYLSISYGLINDFENAYNYSELRNKLKDSIFSQNTSEQLAEIHAKHEDEVEKREFKLLKSENQFANLKLESSKNLTILLIILSIFLLVGITLLFNFNKKKKEINAQLMDKNQDIIELNNELKIKNDRLTTSENHLKSANKTKDKFLSIIAHDLINPSLALKGYAEMLRKDFHIFTYEELQEIVHNIYATTDNQQKLLQNLLTWARTQTGKMEFNPKSFNLHELVAETLKPLDHVAMQKEIRIKSTVNEEIKVFADENMIGTVCRNLVSNAIKFTNSGGNVNLYSSKDKSKIITTIEDSGIGLNFESKENLFKENSNSSNRGTDNESGTGLGLLICKEFIEINGGEIWADSILNEGSKFHFSLPVN